MKKSLIACAVIIACTGCGQQKFVVSNSDSPVNGGVVKTQDELKTAPMPETKPIKGKEMDVRVGIIPNATAFRMSGDYANNIAITLSPSGDILYFPAPSDITADSEPTELCDGWWLNNQGFGPNSVFTKYTFAEYASLPETPSPEQLKLSILPGAKVTGFMELPMKLGEARQNIESAKESVKGY